LRLRRVAAGFVRYMSAEVDVLIVGAGPTGSTAAALARKAGFSVLIAEKEAFPRFRIGESLLPRANQFLRESGAWPKVEEAGFIKKYGAYFFVAGADATKEVIFENGIIQGLEYTYQVDRARFDQILLDHALQLGASFRKQTTVQQVTERADGCEAVLRSGAESEVVRCRWVIDASGRDNALQVGWKREMDPPRLEKRLAIYSHFTGVSRAPGRAAGHTVVIRLDNGWFWFIPIDAERTSVGLVLDVSSFKQSGTPPEDVFWRAVNSAPQLQSRMRNAVATQRFHVTSDYSYFRKRLATGRMVLIGDAAGFFDPIFSSGVYVGLRSAKKAVEMIVQAEAAGRAISPREQQAYSRDIKTHARVFEKLIHAFYDNESFSVFMSPHPPLGIERGIASIVAGHADLTFGLWWRFRVFLFVCWLQRYLPMEKPIEMARTSPRVAPT
jgi:flavin-dependent dehydrogenase